MYKKSSCNIGFHSDLVRHLLDFFKKESTIILEFFLIIASKVQFLNKFYFKNIDLLKVSSIY